MFSHSNNVNINGGEFYNVTVIDAKTSLTTEEVTLKFQKVERGKHICIHFSSKSQAHTQVSSFSRERPRPALFTILMSDMIPQNATHAPERQFCRRSWTGSKTTIVLLGFCGYMDRQELENRQ